MEVKNKKELKMVSDKEVMGIILFMLFLTIWAWIMSLYWANKYNKLERQINEILGEEK